MAEEQKKTVDPKAPPPDKFKRIRPTLYIGLGGSGKEIMLRLRRRILQTLWNGKRVESMDDFPVASFLYFDTYTGKAEDQHKQGKKGAEQDPLLPLIELPKSDCLQKALDIDKYLRGEELERYPHIREWLPQGELRAINAGQGAGQVRSISRLLFFDEVNQLNRIINGKARTLLQNVGNERLQALGLEIEPEVKIVVLCSIAGGTGSGAFIDVGYLCRSLQNPRPEAVYLYALTGGAYAGLNERVLANSYAALAELEYCMRDGNRDTYVRAWTDELANRASRPYDEVYIVDNANLTRQSTGNRTHLFGMIADALFEELHDPVLRGKRAEDLVNQSQHKIQPFIPPSMPEELGRHSQRFSRGYSSFGQVSLYTQGRAEFERETAEAARDMIEAFFRMTEHDKVNHPTGPEIADFLASQLFLDGSGYFQDFPDFLPGAKERTLDDFPLIDRLLQQGETRIDQVLSDHIRSSFAELRESGRDLSEWRAQAELIRQQRDRDIEGAVDSSARDATYPRALKEQRRRIMTELAGKHGLRQALYARLDNQEKGGLSYTIHLIREVRDALTVEGTGICTRLSRTAQALDELATELRQGYYTRALANLEKAVSKRLLRGPDREACLRFLGQAEEATRYYLYYRLRALACREAIALLRDDVIQELGQPSAMGEQSETGATGILAEFERGRNAVRMALKELQAEIRILDDTASSTSPLRSSIPGGGMVADVTVDRKQLAEWGGDALAQYGGSRELFEQLRNDKTRPRIISTLRGKARENMQAREKLLPTVQQALAAMPPAERRKLFKELFSNAMPWVNSDREKDSGWNANMITTFVAVENVEEFMRQFRDEIRPLLPTGLTKELYEVSSGERGRLVVYSEYSGMPLNTLVALHDDWRMAYRQLSSGDKRLPLHNHRRTERFQRPTAMSVEEVRVLHGHLKLYLKGVGLGLLRRRSEPDGRYELNVSQSHVADWQAIGREQQLYLTGYSEGKELLLRRQVEQVEQGMTARQKLLASALFSYIAERSYSRIKVSLAGGAEDRYGGIAHHAALAISEEYRKQFDGSPGRRAVKLPTGELLRALEQCIDRWSDEIPDSIQDTTSQEANLNPNEADAERRAQPKRWMDLAHITDAEVDQLAGLAPSAAAPVATDRAAPPPLPGGPEYYLGINGQRVGPFNAAQLDAKCVAGELTPETLVWRKGLSDWVKAVEIDELKARFDTDAPPPLPSA